ncbi:MAG: dienelactone hydrolase family protein [Sphingobacteriales bacterium]|nr:dienelactone hydrolase family protein [Sphingobacteriales bacterium]
MEKLIGETVFIPVGSVTLEGQLVLPEHVDSIVIFAHGSGSSRFSPRNKYVADVLNDNGFASLLVDLLTPKEDLAHSARFDIPLLTQRLTGVTKWVMEQPVFKNFQIGYFGASTGAASALGAASMLPQAIKAIVSRGGRPDLALRSLPLVKAPVQLIIGSLDDEVIELNRQAYEQLTGIKEMLIVEGATHLFEEPGKLQEVASLAVNWFRKHMG